MSHEDEPVQTRRWGGLPVRLALTTGIACALLGCAPAITQAASRSVTLKATHVSALQATVLAAPSGRTLYRLKPETAHHLLCGSDSCLAIWRPLTVRSRHTQVRLPDGITGRLGFLARGRRFQLTLRGLPLYTYTGDTRSGRATGQKIHSFGGTWLVLTVKKDPPGSTPPPAPTPYSYPTY